MATGFDRKRYDMNRGNSTEQYWYSTVTLSMRCSSMGYTSMRYTSTALYFYEEFTQAPDKNFKKHFKQKICK
jgi:hypothetical protein